MNLRDPRSDDAPAMAALLNDIIDIGGTTAHTTPVSADYFRTRMASDASQSAWSAALDDRLLGMQWVNPNSALPPEACDISTFVRVGLTGRGIGSALFERTADKARALGYRWINAAIRADNIGGLAYYSARGFKNWGTVKAVTLANGQTVDKVLKRFDL